MDGTLGSRDTRGFGVAITEDKLLGTGLIFVLEFRSINVEHEAVFQGPPGIPIGLVGRVCIRFCPWCGANLKRHYSRYKDELHIVPDLLGLGEA